MDQLSGKRKLTIEGLSSHQKHPKDRNNQRHKSSTPCKPHDVISQQKQCNICPDNLLSEGDSWLMNISLGSEQLSNAASEAENYIEPSQISRTENEKFCSDSDSDKNIILSDIEKDLLSDIEEPLIDSNSCFEAEKQDPYDCKEFPNCTLQKSCESNKKSEPLLTESKDSASVPLSFNSKLLQRLQNNGQVSKLVTPIKTNLQNDSLQNAIEEAKQIEKIFSDFPSDTFYGLPLSVKTLIEAQKGVKDLYEWQDECLRLNAVKTRRNLIYSLPTSGGKTLVAEILILKELLCRQHDVLVILPYIAIVQEKVRGMSPFAVQFNFSVEEYAGSKGQLPPKKKRSRHTVYYATIEKGHSLINSLLELKRLSELGLIVIDELHMIGEGGHRGAILESTISKLKFSTENVQIIGMSATLGNMKDIAAFLEAETYSQDFRPVELNEYVKVHNEIFQIASASADVEDCFEPIRKCDFKYSSKMLKSDPDMIAGLVSEVCPQNSCLIFCPTKNNCENVAKMICKFFRSGLAEYKSEEKHALLNALKAEGNGMVCNVLQKTIPFGVAYHHSGLTADERKLLEEGYSNGTLCCLCCTSTLAAGVNLPAKRVILRSPYLGSEFLTYSKYKQMVGRAGRAGIDSSGESILVLKPHEKDRIAELLKNAEEKCTSSLMYGEGCGLETLILSIISLELIKTIEDIYCFLNCTLLAIQAEQLNVDLKTECKNAVSYLQKNNLVSITMANPNEANHEAALLPKITKLGKATSKGSIGIAIANRLWQDLNTSLGHLSLQTHLHLLYLVTPYDQMATIKPNVNLYYKAYMKLKPEDIRVAEILGVTESFITLSLMGKKIKAVDENVSHRFYLTLILYDLWNHSSVWEVANMFQLHRGIVQNLLSSTASFATCVYYFCSELAEFWAYQELLSPFVKQLSYCVTAELIPLMELPAVKKGRARQLYSAGFKTLQDIARAEPKQIVSSVSHISHKVAKQIVSAAKMLLIEKAESLREDAEILIDGLSKLNTDKN